MAMEQVTPRLALPMIVAGQAQKEVTHNEALTLIDAALVPVVEDFGLNAPPGAPAIGQCWIVGGSPAGAWTGRGNDMAVWTAGGWRFVHLPAGVRATERNTGLQWLKTASGWQSPAIVSSPVGGTIVDSECRAVVTALLTALTAQGFISA